MTKRSVKLGRAPWRDTYALTTTTRWLRIATEPTASSANSSRQKIERADKSALTVALQDFHAALILRNSSIDGEDHQVIDSYRPAGRIYLYVCAGPGGKHPFTHGTLQDLQVEKIVAVPGMRLDFYCDDGNERGERDYLLFSGVIDQFPTGDWYAVVDGDRFWHESDIQSLHPE